MSRLLIWVLVLLPLSGKGAPSGREARSPHDLSNPRILGSVILHVKDHCADRERIEPKAMMIAAPEGVEKTVPDVLVEGSAGQGKVRVTAGQKARTFDISHVDTLSQMSSRLNDILRFIKETMRPMDDTRDAEYAAANGMLSALPHSALMRPDLVRELGEIAPGETRSARFRVNVKRSYRGDGFGLRLTIADERLKELATGKIEVPVQSGPPPPVETRRVLPVISLDVDPERGGVVTELGDNSVTAVAWEGRELASRRELVVRRRPAPRPPVGAE